MRRDPSTPQWLQVDSLPEEPTFDDLAPGDTVHWIARVTNEGDHASTLSVELTGRPGPLTGSGGLVIGVQACPEPWASTDDDAWTCPETPSTVLGPATLATERSAELPSLAAGEPRDYLVTATLPTGATNETQRLDGTVVVSFTGTVDDAPGGDDDLVDTGLDPAAALSLGMACLIGGFVLAVLPSRLHRSTSTRRRPIISESTGPSHEDPGPQR